MPTVRTRFAPSPTGYLHLGSARTALYNWAFARHHGGQFVLRVEDTDLQRSTLESEEAVLEGMRWLGLDWDEGPFRQSDHADRHREVVAKLIDEGKAYRCTCSRESLEERKQADLARGGKGIYDGRCRNLELGPDCGDHVVRLRLPAEGMLGFDDAVFGPSGQDASEIGDGIIVRTDGTALFHLAVVIDDIDMGITHVIRGADHHPNTPFQVALYEAIGAPLPIFAHVPLIVADSGKKLSKRRDNVSIQQFRDEGYLESALVNWLVRLGWSHGDDEVFDLGSIEKLFDLDAVGRSAARADLAKLQWLNQHYIKELPMDELLTQVAPHLERVAGAPVADTPALRKLLDLLRERSKTLAEMAELAHWQIRDAIEYDEKAAKKHLKASAGPILRELQGRLSGCDDWSEGVLEAVFNDTAAALGDLKLGKLAQPVRVAVTGGPNSPGIFETLAVLGRERTLERIQHAAEMCEARAEGA